ncbi:MAG: hypothetical protein J3K34DRAFT_526306 [Monoraphidium minutum]|nr:MAG: hypothetical protein J3K34DRAFT_526306 [Monoraphidium minutum]
MGAKCLLLYHPPGGGAPTGADAERVVSALQRVCAARDMTAVTAPRSMCDVWLLQLPRDAPDRVFLCNLKARQAVEADASIAQALLDKRLEYRAKAMFLVTSRTWQLGDRRGSDASVKLLQLQVHGQAPLAVALEVTYHPVSSPAAAAPALAELSAALAAALDGAPDAGRLEVLAAPWEDFAAWLPPEASPAHTAVLYAHLVVTALRERGAAAAAARRAAAAAP